MRKRKHTSGTIMAHGFQGKQCFDIRVIPVSGQQSAAVKTFRRRWTQIKLPHPSQTKSAKGCGPPGLEVCAAALRTFLVGVDAVAYADGAGGIAHRGRSWSAAQARSDRLSHRYGRWPVLPAVLWLHLVWACGYGHVVRRLKTKDARFFLLDC